MSLKRRLTMSGSRSRSLPRDRSPRRPRSPSQDRSDERKLSRRSRSRSKSPTDRHSNQKRGRSRSRNPHNDHRRSVSRSRSVDEGRHRDPRKHKKQSKKSRRKEEKKVKKQKRKKEKLQGEDEVNGSSSTPEQVVDEEKAEKGTQSTEKPADARSFFEQLKMQEAAKGPVGTIHSRGLPAPVSATAMLVSDKWECSKAGCGHMNSKHAPACNKCGAMKRLTEWR